MSHKENASGNREEGESRCVCPAALVGLKGTSCVSFHPRQHLSPSLAVSLNVDSARLFPSDSGKYPKQTEICFISVPGEEVHGILGLSWT